MKAENFGNHPYEGEYIKEEEEFTEEEYDDEIENENNGSIKRRKEYDATYKKKRKTQGSDNVTPNIELNNAFDDVHIQHHQMETPSRNTPNRNSKRLSILSKSTPATIATPRQTNTTPKYHNSNRTTRSDLLSPRIDNITNSLEQSYNNSIIQSPQRIPSTSSQNVIEQEEVVTPPTSTSGTFTSKLLLISLLLLPTLSIFLYFDQQERIHEISYSIKRKAQLFYDFSTSTLKQTYIIDKMMDLLNEKADRSEVERMMKSSNSGTCSNNNYNFEFGKFVSKDELHETIGYALHELEYKITTRLNTRVSELSKENKVDLEMAKADIKKEISKIKLEIQQMVEEQINKKVSPIPQSPSQLVNSIKKQDIESTIESTVNNMRTDIKKEILPVVKKMIDQAIEVYASDRINMTDFALISMGSRIVEHSPTFTSNGWGNWLVSTKQPGIMLQTDVTIGNCWPMKGKSGYVVIQIAFPITPTHFSIDHIPASLSPDISSAPKLFSIYGYDNHTSLVKLTDYEYNINGPAVQTFPVSETIVSKFQLFRLQIKDNYGNENYTCIYRFRIHGKHD